MSDYFVILLPFLIFQILVIVLYFFVRVDGFPRLAAASLVAGSLLNIGLDYVLIAVYGLGLKGAAWATGISQALPFLVLCSYFFHPNRKLVLSLKVSNWFEVCQAALNGLSDFINEISAGIIAFILNWLLISTAGVNGVAAITVINYLLMVGMMLSFALGDACQVIISQNFGARNDIRIRQFLTVALVSGLIVSLICIGLLLGFTQTIISLFLDASATHALELATSYVSILWIIFAVNSINIIIAAYLTALHLPIQSGIVSFGRSLAFPACLLLMFYFLIPSIIFLWALPIAEVLAFILSIVYLLRHSPHQEVTKLGSEAN